MILTGTLILCPITNVETSRACNYHAHTNTYTLVPHVHSAVSHSHPHVEMLACSQYEQYQSWQLLSISLFQPTVITGLQESVSQSNNIASLYYSLCVLRKKFLLYTTLLRVTSMHLTWTSKSVCHT